MNGMGGVNGNTGFGFNQDQKAIQAAGSSLDSAEARLNTVIEEGADNATVMLAENEYRDKLRIFETLSQIMRTKFDMAMRLIQRLRLN